MGRPRGQGWLTKEPSAKATGWRLPPDVIQGVTDVLTGADVSEEQLVTKWLREKIKERRGNKRKIKP